MSKDDPLVCDEKVAAILEKKPRSHWIELLGKVGVPCGEIRTVGEVCEAEQLVSRGMIVSSPHSSAGVVRSIAGPVLFQGSERVSSRAPPTLGQHTREILSDLLGMPDESIDDLASRRVIRLGHQEESPGQA